MMGGTNKYRFWSSSLQLRRMHIILDRIYGIAPFVAALNNSNYGVCSAAAEFSQFC